jgi:hypothetical protein
MKYLVIVMFLFLIFYIYVQFKTNLSKTKYKSYYRYRQSHIHSIISPFLKLSNLEINKKITQSQKHFNKTNLKVIIVDGDAYWIQDNILYTSKMGIDGIDPDNTSRVDTISMDSVQLDKILFIVDQLKGRNQDDSGNSGIK